MNQTYSSNSLRRILSALLAFSLLLGCIPCMVFLSSAENSFGAFFTAEETYTMERPVSAAPLTVEATVYLPKNYSSRGGVIVGNYAGAKGCFGIEIHESGVPRIYIIGDGLTVDKRFSSVNVATGSSVHLAITLDVPNGSACCYVNGVLKQTLTGITYPTSPFVTTPAYMIGGDYRSSNTQYFKGGISNLALYSDIRSAEEIAEDYANGSALSDASILCAYDLTAAGEAKCSELSGKGAPLLYSDAIGGTDFEISGELVSSHTYENAPETLETWIYLPANHAGRAGCLMGTYPAKAALNFEIYTNGNPRLYCRDSDGTVHNFLFTEVDVRGAWVHLALVHDAENGKVLCYVNGSLAAEKTEDASGAAVCAYDEAITDTAFGVGSDVQQGNLQFFKGRMKEIAVWSDARSAEEIQHSYKNGIEDGNAALIAHYNMDTEGLARLRDLSGNGYHLRYTGTDAQLNLDGAGFSFASDRVYPLVKPLNAAPETLEAWILLPNGYTERAGSIIGNYNGGTSFNFEVRYNGEPRLYYRDASGTSHSFVFSDLNVATGEWTHLTLVHDVASGEVRCYLNGALAGTLTKDEAGQGVTAYENGMFAKAPVLGSDLQSSANPLYFKGRVAGLAMYSEVRSAEEIYEDYRRGADKTDGALILSYDLLQSEARCLIDRSGNGHTLVDETLGTAFLSETTYRNEKFYAAAPETLEAWVYVPTGYTARPGVILGNYPSTDCINFEIQIGGKPRLYYKDSSGTAHSFVFNSVDIRGAWAHVALVHDVASAQILCYVNGVLAETMTADASGASVGAYGTTAGKTAFAIGGDVQNGNAQYFKGRISGVTLYSDIRTPEEIYGDYLNGASLSDPALLADYLVENALSYEDIPDRSGNGYDMLSTYRNIWVGADEGAYTGDYDYSFAIVGDTQALSYRYSNNAYKDALPGLYDWIVDNVESKKIQHVIGLGDITETDSDAEWTFAKSAITKLDGVVPYSLIRGQGHDTVAQLDAYFASHTPLTDTVDGYMTEGSLKNYYQKFTVGTTKYMLLALDFGIPDEAMVWANEVIASNPDYRVIITTHAYLDCEGDLLGIGDKHYASAYDSTYNNGEDVWEQLVSKHSNIAMILCGHKAVDTVVMTPAVGNAGNPVMQMLVDPQDIDAEYAGGTGMVAMLYFSNGGKDVAVEYYSTVRDQYLPLQSFSVETVARNGAEEYTTLTEALGAAQDGDTVTLLDDVAPTVQSVVNNAVTLDLNEKTLTLPAFAQSYALLVKDALTVKNGSVHLLGAYGIEAGEGATLAVQSGTFTATEDCVSLLGGAGTLSVSGGSFTHALPKNAAADGYVLAYNGEADVWTAIPNVYFEFLGGALRYSDAVEGKAHIRFGYDFSDDFVLEGSNWRWEYGFADSESVYEGVGVNYTEEMITNLVITGVTQTYWERELTSRLIFEVELDGTRYTVYDSERVRSVRGVAESILADSELENEKCIAYAQSIIDALEA